MQLGWLRSVRSARLMHLLFAGLFTLSGCATPEPGYVAKKWSKNMRELGIYPVFPPKEQFFVGDVYLPPTDPRGEDRAFREGDFLPLGVFLGRRQRLADDVSSFYRSLPDFPETTTSLAQAVPKLQSSAYELIPEPNAGARDIFLKSDVINRLRVVGFPEFMSATYTGADLSAVVPVQALQVAAGATISDVQSVSIRVPIASAYGLPVPLVLDPLIKDKKLALSEINVVEENFELYIPPGQYEKGVLPKHVYVDVITEVYFARAIDVETSFKSSYGARVGITLPSATNNGASSTGVAAASASTGTPPNSPASSTKGDTSPSASTASGAAQAAASEASRTLDSLMTRDRMPGGTISVTSASVGGVNLRRSFAKPVAIGYRGIRLKVKRDTLEIVGASEVSIGVKRYGG